MRILLSNDDGINAPGLYSLATALDAVGDLLIVAPEREQSCSSHGITLHKPLRMKQVTLDGLEHVSAYHTSGTPADCVVLSRYEEECVPDIVVAGINSGANMGEEVFYSGTVAAAMEGCLQGLKSIAVSVTAYENIDYRAAAEFVTRLVPAYIKCNLPEGILLNVNVPNLAPEEIKGVQVTRLGRRQYENFIDRRLDPRGRAYYWFSGEVTEIDSADGTDIAATTAGYISVTPICFDVTSYDALEAVGALLSVL